MTAEPSYTNVLPRNIVHTADFRSSEGSSLGIETDIKTILQKLFKYILEGLAVGIAAFYLPRLSKNSTPMSNEEILTISVTAAAILALLDVFAPSIGKSFRLGSGFGIGGNLVQFNPVTA